MALESYGQACLESCDSRRDLRQAESLAVDRSTALHTDSFAEAGLAFSQYGVEGCFR